MKLANGPLTSLADIPEAFHELYTQETTGDNSGKYVLTGVETGYKATRQLKDEAGRYRIERNDYQKKFEDTSLKLAAFGDLSADDVKAKLDRITELEESAKGKVPEAKLNELADARAAAKIAPLQKQLKESTDKLAAYESTIKGFETARDTEKVLGETRKLAGKLGFDEASYTDPTGALNLMSKNIFKVDADGNVVAAEGSGFTPGLTPAEVLPELLEKHPYLSKLSEGTGSRGSSGTPGAKGANVFYNPNLTERFQLQKTNAKEYDRQYKLAQASGLTDEYETLSAKKPA
jgi:hypothetical protein